MTIKITMYTKNDCPNCKRAKFMFEACPVDVEIIEKNIDEQPCAYETLVEVHESTTLPTFVFENGAVVRGFYEGEIMRELGL